MQPTELRIGNLLFYTKASHEIIVVNTISKDSSLEYIQPIPLTPEILLKVGFDYDDINSDEYCDWYEYSYSYERNGELYHEHLPFQMFKGESHIELEYFDTEIKYLHQLQNLVFALTGTELNVDELLK